MLEKNFSELFRKVVTNKLKQTGFMFEMLEMFC